jgi:NlpC/P60 family
MPVLINLLHPKVHLRSEHCWRTWRHPWDLCRITKVRYKRTMRFHGKGALLLHLFWLAAIPAASAQQKLGRSNDAYRVTRESPDQQRKAIRFQPLTLDEGLAILGAALDSRHHAGSPSDCSHFVHALYQRAGFPYVYAPSQDLYAGLDHFRRVTNPQPGDLAVWRGHAGIVINPAQHSFFSLLRSGPGVDSYDSTYWNQRGRPRFFRYVRAVPGGVLSSSLRTAPR